VAKKCHKKRSKKVVTNAAKQESGVRPSRPGKKSGNPNLAKEGEPYQWKPGESGNPAGAPKAKMNLWRYICEYVAMTPEQLKALDTNKLIMAQIIALKHVEKMGKGEYNRLRDTIDRSEGKVPDHIVQQTVEMTNAEAMEILRIRDKKLNNGKD